jgi:hypothetical protein
LYFAADGLWKTLGFSAQFSHAAAWCECRFQNADGSDGRWPEGQDFCVSNKQASRRIIKVD